MREQIEQHLALRQVQGQQQETVKISRHCLLTFEDYCLKRRIALQELTSEQVEDYRQHLLWTASKRTGRLPAPATVDQYLRMLRTFLRWATVQQCLGQDPTTHWVLSRPRARPEALLSREALDAILKNPDTSQPQGLRDRALLGVMCELGLFSRQCRALDLADLDRTQARLRGLLLSPHLAEYLFRYLDRGRPALLTNPNETALFLTRQGRRMNQESVTARAYHHSHDQAGPRALRRAWLTHQEAALNRRLPPRL